MSQVIHGPQNVQPDEVKICFLCDPRDGRVLHHHMVATYPGARQVDEMDVEGRDRQFTVARAGRR